MQSSNSETEVKKEQVYFLTSENAATTFLGKPSWCPLSERRLLNKLATFKPCGVRKNMNLQGLLHAMHHITEDEYDVDFDDYLLPDDYKLYLERQKTPQNDIMIFPPKYRFRPSAEEIMKKIKEYYDVDVLTKYEELLNSNTTINEYRLPTYLQTLNISR